VCCSGLRCCPVLSMPHQRVLATSTPSLHPAPPPPHTRSNRTSPQYPSQVALRCDGRAVPGLDAVPYCRCHISVCWRHQHPPSTQLHPPHTLAPIASLLNTPRRLRSGVMGVLFRASMLSRTVDATSACAGDINTLPPPSSTPHTHSLQSHLSSIPLAGCAPV
jgi:hypothetical protein